MFPMVLKRVRVSVIYVRQWRRKCAVDSVSKPQLQNGFKESWKLCLNLRSRKWLKSSRSLVINSIPFGLWQLKRLLADGLINFKILFLKILKLLEFLMLWSSLFHSIIADGKKAFFKKVCLVLRKGILFLKGLVWRDDEDIHCWRVCKSKIDFGTNDVVEGTPNLSLHIVFPLKCLWLLLLLRTSIVL